MNNELARTATLESEKPRLIDKLARRVLLNSLKQLSSGQIVISERAERFVFGATSDDLPLSSHITVNNPRFYSEVAFGGTIGSGEAFMQDYWRCDDLTTLIRILLRNAAVLEQVGSGLASLSKPIRKLLHKLNRNTYTGSRRNIAAHYDLGNDFYQLWLDERMMYSCAFFDTPDMSLDDAATSKLERICRKLQLGRDDSVIEIGTGWGGFAVYAAQHYGCHVTTTTISRQQYEHAQAAVNAAGVADRVTLLLDDYRDLNGHYDKLVSIEMIEAVGHQFHADFFRKCQQLLKPDGLMLLQAITIADQRYDSYISSVDFIQRYIFPGGCLTSVTDMARVTTLETDMRMIHLEDIGPHYATTLRLWHDRFFEKVDEVRKLGHSNAFIRLWQFYFCYCESAFIERATGTVQMLMMRPEARVPKIKPEPVVI